jgi:hypothetical protein
MPSYATNTGKWGKRAGAKNTGTGQLGQESLARTGQPVNVEMVQAEQERENRMGKT